MTNKPNIEDIKKYLLACASIEQTLEGEIKGMHEDIVAIEDNLEELIEEKKALLSSDGNIKINAKEIEKNKKKIIDINNKINEGSDENTRAISNLRKDTASVIIKTKDSITKIKEDMKSKANSKEVKEAFEEIYNVLDTFKGTKKDNITVFGGSSNKGTTRIRGVGVPSDTIGSKDNYYLDTSSGSIYIKDNTRAVIYTPVATASNVSLDDTHLKVSKYTNLQAFAEGADLALLKARGTGVHESYVASVTIGGTTFNMTEVYGEINSDEGYFDVHYTGATGISLSNVTATSTYVYLDKSGVLQQQITIPTRQDLVRKIFLVRIAVNAVTNVIINFEYFNNPIGHYANSIRDVYKYLLAAGVPFRIGQTVTGRTDNLGFDIGAGSIMEFGGTGDIYNPNVKSFDSVSNASYFLFNRTAGEGANTNLVKYWDNNGTGAGDDGDIMIKITAGGVTKTATLVDFSSL